MRISASWVASLAVWLAACGGKAGSGDVDAYNFMDAAGSNDRPIAGDCPMLPSEQHLQHPDRRAAGRSRIRTRTSRRSAARQAPPRSRSGRRSDERHVLRHPVPGRARHHDAVADREVHRGRLRRLRLEAGRRRAIAATVDHSIDSPCTHDPILPIPDVPLVEGGINTTPRPAARRRSPHADRR